MKYLPIVLVATVLPVACTTPNADTQIKAFSAAVDDISDDIGKTLDGDIAAEAKARRDAAIAAGTPHYVVSPACLLDDRTLSGPELSKTATSLLNCDLHIVGESTRASTTAEQALFLLGLMADYVAALDAVAKSTLPDDIESSTATLLSEIRRLATAAKEGTEPESAFFERADLISAATGFALRRYKARILRRATASARIPISDTVDSLVAYMIANGHEPLVKAIAELRAAEDRMRAAPGNAARVTALEAKYAAYLEARKKSPAIGFMSIRNTHNALADRINGPVTIDEVQALAKELAELAKHLED